MRSRPFRLFVLGIFVLGLGSCVAPPEVPLLSIGRYDREAERYAARDGKEEAAAAFSKSDYHFIKAMGFTDYMPGIQDGRLADSLEEKFGAKYLRDTSDAIEGKGHHRYIEAATGFAEEYNGEMLRRLRSAGEVR